MGAEQPESFYANVLNYFDKAAARTKCPAGLLAQIKHCNGVYCLMFPVKGDDGEFFTVEMSLKDKNGTVVSGNVHTLSIGDQQTAKEHCLKIHGELMEEKESLGKGYYRYHPELLDLD